MIAKVCIRHFWHLPSKSSSDGRSDELDTVALHCKALLAYCTRFLNDIFLKAFNDLKLSAGQQEGQPCNRNSAKCYSDRTCPSPDHNPDHNPNPNAT